MVTARMTIGEDYVGILSSVKPLYYLCKIAGLVPFSFSVNIETGAETISTDAYSNKLSVAWSLVILLVLLGGTVRHWFVIMSSMHVTALYVAAFMIGFPLTKLMSALIISMNLTVNRQKFCELWKKMNDIDVALLQYGGPTRGIWFKVEMALLLLVLLPYMCVDAWLWRGRMTFIGEATVRLAHLIQLLVVVQFCKLTQSLRRSLKILNAALSETIEDELKTPFVAAKGCPNNGCSKVNYIGIAPVVGHQSTQRVLTNIENISQDILISNGFTRACNLLKIRHIYVQIYEAVDCVNSIYGLPVLLELVRNILAVIVYILQINAMLRNAAEQSTSIIYHPSYALPFLAACWIVLFISREVAITLSCHMATTQARKLQDNVQRILLRQHIRPKTLEQLKLFSAQLIVNRIEFTAFGFFTLNLSTLSTFTASVMTYVVVVEQIK
jgi:hypothetical protein